MLCSVFLVLLIVSKAIATVQSWWLSIFCWVTLMLAVMLAFVLAGFLSTCAFLCQVPRDRVICCSLKKLFMVAWFPIYAWLLCVPNEFTLCGGHFSKAKDCFTTWSKVLNTSEAGQTTVSHWFFCHPEVNQSSGFQREQVNAMSTWQAPPCDEDWETGKELPPSATLLTSLWSCFTIPLRIVWVQRCHSFRSHM